ncbi:MAG TPA: DUF1398 family protein [Opitutaceae bacterium]|nr:DUF1398 family protein [Opitutaceae bacterium]
MSTAIDTLKAAQQRAMATRPKVGGFPHFAETLRQAGVLRNYWTLPGCQCLFLTKEGAVAMQSTPLITGMADVPTFDREAVIRTLRTDQAGQSTFPEFLASAWKAGVVRYSVDFEGRTCTYYGSAGEEYLEEYASVEL